MYLITVHCASDGSVVSSRAEALTAGEAEVDAAGIWLDATHQLIYFGGTFDSPLRPQLYVISYEAVRNHAGAATAGPAPLSRMRRLTAPEYSHAIIMSDDCSVFATTFSNVRTMPQVALYGVTHGAVPSSVEGIRLVPLLCLSAGPQPQLCGPLVPELFQFDTADGVKLHGLMVRPPDFDPARRYAAIQYVYNGPGVQLVVDKYSLVAHRRLRRLALLGYVVFMVDGRGSSHRGVAFAAPIQGTLATAELRDQMAGLAHVLQHHAYIDPARVAVHGWSYGGYLSLMALARHSDAFRLAVACAPVTSWELYDTAYTERYLGTPANNPLGYADSSVVTYAQRLPDGCAALGAPAVRPAAALRC